MISKKTLLIIVIAFFTSTAFSQIIVIKECDSLIDIALEKSEYNPKEVVKVEISNLSKDTLERFNLPFSPESIRLMMKKGDEWIQLNIHRASGGIRGGVLYPFLPNEMISFIWNQKYVVKTRHAPIIREYVLPGTYRFEFHFIHSKKPDSKRNYYVTYSKEFEIK